MKTKPNQELEAFIEEQKQNLRRAFRIEMNIEYELVLTPKRSWPGSYDLDELLEQSLRQAYSLAEKKREEEASTRRVKDYNQGWYDGLKLARRDPRKWEEAEKLKSNQ